MGMEAVVSRRDSRGRLSHILLYYTLVLRSSSSLP